MRTKRRHTLEQLESREMLSGVTSETSVYAAGTARTAIMYNLGGMVEFEVVPYGDGFSGGVRTAVADVDGDGVPDLITAPGQGTPVRVRVFSGVNGRPLGSFLGFEESFTGGGYVAAADLDRDGKAEIIVSPDEGGAPRVRVLAGANGYQVLADFFGLDAQDFRGGARVATGDVNGDGVPDVLVGAGIGGGPRVAIFDGIGVAEGGTPRRIVSDFFVFDKTLRNGVYLSAGDLNGDAFDDLVFGGGPGGGPRVYAIDSAEFVRSGGDVRKELVNTFAFHPSQRGGVRVAAGDVTGDGATDLLVGSGSDGGSQVRVLESPDYNRPRAKSFSVSGSATGAFPSVASDTSPSRANGDYLKWKPRPNPPTHSHGQSIKTPTAPSALTAAVVSDTGIDLVWADNSGNETGFVAERATDAAFTQQVAVSDLGANTTTMTVTGLSAGTTYYFRVRAVNTNGESADSNTATATTTNPTVPPPVTPPPPASPPPPVTPPPASPPVTPPPPASPPPPAATAPAAPSGLTSTVVSTSRIDLAWVDNSDNETGFVVERAADAAFTQQVVAVGGGADATGLTFTGLSAGTTYYFRVRAVNAVGASADSNTASATTPAPTSTPPRITDVRDQAVTEGRTTGPVPFTVADDESAAAGLTVSAVSSNPSLIPASGLVLGGSGGNRTVTVTPAPGQTGTAVVTLTVADPGGLTATDTFTVTVTSPLPGVNSPTGRNPRLVWTTQQQAVWDRMRAENHPWWVLVKSNADKTGTANERYGDYGQWATLVYQMTGDTAYAAKAWGKLSSWMGQLPSWGRNGTRENFAEFVMLYDWLYPALTVTQRTTFIDTLNMWGDAVLQISGWGTRSGDSDELVGHYFGLALLDLATGPDNPRAGTFLSRSWHTGYATKTVGGLDATGVNRETMRNEISEYIRLAEGGQWIESSDYNQGTLKLLIMGVQGVKTATGVDHFPEVTRYLKQAALAQIHEMTADLEAAYQWGDEEHPRDLTLYKRVTVLGMLAGVTQDDPQVGPYVNRLVADLVAKYGATGWGNAEPWARLFLFYNPYAPQADWRTGLPAAYYSSGVGRLDVHPDWGTGGSYFGVHMPNRLFVDHEVAYFGDFQLYRNGEWAITRPLGYSGPAISGESANSMVIAGLSSMTSRAVVAQASAPDGSWSYIAGTTGGQYYAQPFWDPPPTFLHEWTRSIFYLPSADNRSDTVITFDRVDADDPTSLPKFDRYYPTERDAITSAPALKQWVIHTPVQPTLSEGAITWTTTGGQEMRVSTLQPLNQTRTVYNEDQLWPNPPYWNFYESEKQYQVRVVPTTEQRWDTFLNVVQASDPGTALNNVGVRSDGGEASGVLVQRGGLADALVMFGARQDTRILSTGYSMNWTAGASSTDLYFMDLDSTKTWSIRINGGAATPLAVSSQGVAQLTVAGTGTQSVQLVAV